MAEVLKLFLHLLDVVLQAPLLLFGAAFSYFHAYIPIAFAAVCLAACAVYLKVEKPAVRQIMKTVASVSFVCVGVNQALCSAFDARAIPVCSLLMLAGLISGAVGDVLLESSATDKKLFAAGVAAFAAGHLFYIAAFALYDPRILPVAAIPAAVLTLVIVFPLYMLLDVKGGMRFAIPPYAFVLSFMASCAVVLAVTASDNRFYIIAPGAVFFLVSDLLLCIAMFGKKKRPSVSKISLTTYYIGQLLIAYGLYLPRLFDFCFWEFGLI